MGKDGALPQHLHARVAITVFALLIGAAAARAGVSGVPGHPAETVPTGGPSTLGVAPGSGTSTEGTDDDLVTTGTVPSRAIAGLSSGRQLRQQADREASAAAVESPQASPVTQPPVTQPTAPPPPVTQPPVTQPPAPATQPPAPAVPAPTTSAPVPPTAPPTTPPAPSSTGSGIWDAIAACESGGRWDLDTGNGYYGGLQFLASTWELHGGLDAAPLPHLASREAQIAVAERVVAASGGSYRAWGACATSLGLP